MPIKVGKVCNSVLLLYLLVIKSDLAKRPGNYILHCHHSMPSTVFFFTLLSPSHRRNVVNISPLAIFTANVRGTFLGFTSPDLEIAMPHTLNQHRHHHHLHIPLVRSASYTELMHCENKTPDGMLPHSLSLQPLQVWNKQIYLS